MLRALYNSFPFDFLLRNSLSQPSIPQGTFEQIAIPAPESLSPLERDFLRSRSLELTYTAWNLTGFASEAGTRGAIQMDEDRRSSLDVSRLVICVPRLRNE